jgi:hypothetical protein
VFGQSWKTAVGADVYLLLHLGPFALGAEEDGNTRSNQIDSRQRPGINKS